MTADVRDGDGMFEPIRSGRVSESIVGQIKDLIRRGQLSSGDRLPSERQLSESFGVSRVTVRDALRMLEAVGLIEIRVGAGGGAFITSPGSAHMAEGLANLLSLRSISPDELTEAREIIERGLLPTVCERATDQDLADLEAICQQSLDSLESDDHYDVRLSAAFHVRLAKASHNGAMAMVVESLHGPLLESLIVAQEAAPEMGRKGTDEHLQIIDAIRKRDPERAQRIMGEHVERTRARIHDRLSRRYIGAT